MEIGSEETPEEYVAKMVEVFRDVRRVLRMDGVVFLNLGDTYANSGENRNGKGSNTLGATEDCRTANHGTVAPQSSLRSGNLCGIPWRVAFALQADGWILRQDIIWAKRNPMPESVQSRCTKSHEYLFLLTQGMDYYWDREAIKENARESTLARNPYDRGGNKSEAIHATDKGRTRVVGLRDTMSANKRSVWTTTTGGYPGCHYAVFPSSLIEPCILAGTSEYGACARCGCPWVRVMSPATGGAIGQARLDHKDDSVKGNFKTVSSVGYTPGTTLGWSPQCNCPGEEVRPCIVLDPFIGSGTTCAVSIMHGRASWGIDLSEKYLRENAIPRIEGELLSRPGLAHLVPRK